MALTDKQIRRLVSMVFEDLKKFNMVTFKAKEEKVQQRAMDLLRAEFEKERQLDEEVNRMMDDLERQNPGEFQRFKMFPLLKKRLAKERKVIL